MNLIIQPFGYSMDADFHARNMVAEGTFVLIGYSYFQAGHYSFQGSIQAFFCNICFLYGVHQVIYRSVCIVICIFLQ